jgi:DNA-binding NtrC family response regulator
MPRGLPTSPESFPSVTVNLGMEHKPSALAPTRRILLLEDRSDYRNVLREHLLSSSYKVSSVPSGIEGLREIMNARFDVIICDMMMPKMGGEMFYWAVTRVRPAAHESFIFFTGHKNNPAMEFFFKRIKARVLYKPFKLSALDTAIEEIFLKLG